MNKSENPNIIGECRSESINKVKISHLISYSMSSNDKSDKTNIIGKFRSEFINKVKISHQISFDTPRDGNITKTSNCISSGNSAELARVMVRAYSDFKYIDVDNHSVRLGSGTKIEKFQNLLMSCILFNLLYLSICGTDEF